MRIQNGTQRHLLDKRDYSFSRSYGTLPVILELMDYSYDIGKTMPDQNAEGYPYGCRAYALADIAGNEDEAIYKPNYSCDKIAYFEGTPTIEGGDIRTALKVGQVYGVQRLDETTEGEAETHRRGSFYNVDQVAGYDWFDSFRSALRTGKRPISVGTGWFAAFERIGSDGLIFPVGLDYNTPNYSWHNYAIVGEKTIGNTPCLIAKTWQGRNYGDKGLCYFNREAWNKTFDYYGTVAFIQPPFSPQDTYTITLTLYQTVILYLGRILGLIAHS